MPSEPKIQILVADDQEIVRLGIKALLAGTEIKVVAEASTGQAAAKLALEREVDLVLLDVRMPDGDGLTVLGRIKLDKPKLPVVLFSAFENPATVAGAIALGASGFLLKNCSRDNLLSAIRTVATGERIWSKETLRSAGHSLRIPRVGGSLEASLSDRETDVLRQMAFGLTNKQIATEMKISYEMVKEHVQNIFGKIGVDQRTQAALWAIRNDLA
jgi:DNA-binding NarL/FixJ family response regulator